MIDCLYCFPAIGFSYIHINTNAGSTNARFLMSIRYTVMSNVLLQGTLTCCKLFTNKKTSLIPLLFITTYDAINKTVP